ncbi:MAG: DUF1638 domain-containing protein [Planctomycetota bacterium]
MRLKVLACETLFREVYRAASESPHVCDIKLLPRALHDDLSLMRETLQEEVALTNTTSRKEADLPGVHCPVCAEGEYNAVILAMGLCGNTTLGLQAGRAPLALPRVHDCHGLLLGGNSQYLDEEKRTVFYHQGAVERLGAARVDAVPRRFGLGRTLAEYIRQYGEDNGRYIYEMEHRFAQYNDRALFIYREDLHDVRMRCEEEVREYAAQFGWAVVPVPVRMGLIRRLLSGDWESDEVIVVPPGETLDVVVGKDGSIARRQSIGSNLNSTL